MSSSLPFLYKIVLTGGPCGGKTISLAHLSSYVQDCSFEVLTYPEAYTILASNYMSLCYYKTEGMSDVIQHTMVDVQMNLEDSAYMTQYGWKDLLIKQKEQRG
eukprot:699244-Ditylum_brightwellii.AAC.1